MIIREKETDAAVIGSGSAGLACALLLDEAGIRTVLVTENMRAGTSRNTGSDKQTYYKLSIAGNGQDSVRAMAEDLFSGGAVDGDTALTEAALSVRGFCRLLDIGVPFPCNEYGEYMGYRTDHDRGGRATSAGPYTSRIMTDCLERFVRERRIPILDHEPAIRLLVKKNRIRGVLCLDLNNPEKPEYLLLWCKALVLATGGPAGMFRDSVYPLSQTGSSGMAFEAGVLGKNLTEWQFGLSSLRPRWNVSGTYMQVIPRMISVDEAGNEKEFLTDFFQTPGEMMSAVFMKGYQWPFDVEKVFGGSSVIDLLVYQETMLHGRRVYLDYTRNPLRLEEIGSLLSTEAREYLEKNGALGGNPFERLAKMNAPAVQFYRDHGTDLAGDRLEIGVCVQHNNGGLSTDANGETNIENLFAVGEVCGSHGVKRPGGSALNAGQTGALRVSGCIRRKMRYMTSDPETDRIRKELREEAKLFAALPDHVSGKESCADILQEAAAEMSIYAGMIRSRDHIVRMLESREKLLSDFSRKIRRPGTAELSLFYRARDLLISQKTYLTAMEDYTRHGSSRGSALYTDPKGELPLSGMAELFRCRLDGGKLDRLIQETGPAGCLWRPVRPIPEKDETFEIQWRAFRSREGLI